MFDFVMEYLVPKSLQNISLFHLQGPFIGSNIKCLGEYEKSNSVNISCENDVKINNRRMLKF